MFPPSDFSTPFMAILIIGILAYREGFVKRKIKKGGMKENVWPS
jgi:hypothetical protein